MHWETQPSRPPVVGVGTSETEFVTDSHVARDATVKLNAMMMWIKACRFQIVDVVIIHNDARGGDIHAILGIMNVAWRTTPPVAGSSNTTPLVPPLITTEKVLDVSLAANCRVLEFAR